MPGNAVTTEWPLRRGVARGESGRFEDIATPGAVCYKICGPTLRIVREEIFAHCGIHAAV